MCCQKASCASDATACCPTASANNCCTWHAPCSPSRAASRCRCLLRRTAISGTVPDAEKPCASSSASPQLSSISQASTLHDHRRQSAPPACSPHVSDAVCAQQAEQLQEHALRYPKLAPQPTSQATAYLF